ncbi:MAG: YggS family pyridoxal phosphate-dependent enzyme [Candidatus Omnitrophica bacterium]|nr:YggS family pyridoxal phosphate-dependent enzyme [Candidatus Omnitrophota bacterium]
MGIKENYLKIKKEIPDYVKVVLAAKLKTAEEISEVISAGEEIIGENYVQEAEKMYEALGEQAKKTKWHMIGPLQKNKINKALKVFDCIETIDSVELAEAVNKRAAVIKREVPVFIEINIGSEITKSGVKPEYEIIEKLAKSILGLNHLKLEGLMTVGPRTGDPEEVRPYFRKTKEIFDKLKNIGTLNVDLKYLSMGMSNSYRIAIEEGANIVRLGTVIFGERKCNLKT